MLPGGKEEGSIDAVFRKTKHELNMSLNNVDLHLIGKVIYSASSDSSYGEHECT